MNVNPEYIVITEYTNVNPKFSCNFDVTVLLM